MGMEQHDPDDEQDDGLAVTATVLIVSVIAILGGLAWVLWMVLK